MTIEDAEAYAAWLDRSGMLPKARLCTEKEWERAARGADAREFPHGEDLAGSEANIDETYAKEPASMGPDEVGSYPVTASPFGLQDMAGNVLEWTRSALEPNEIVVRGGAFFYAALVERATNRIIMPPTMRDAANGLRLCASIARR